MIVRKYVAVALAVMVGAVGHLEGRFWWPSAQEKDRQALSFEKLLKEEKNLLNRAGYYTICGISGGLLGEIAGLTIHHIPFIKEQDRPDLCGALGVIVGCLGGLGLYYRQCNQEDEQQKKEALAKVYARVDKIVKGGDKHIGGNSALYTAASELLRDRNSKSPLLNIKDRDERLGIIYERVVADQQADDMAAKSKEDERKKMKASIA